LLVAIEVVIVDFGKLFVEASHLSLVHWIAIDEPSLVLVQGQVCEKLQDLIILLLLNLVHDLVLPETLSKRVMDAQSRRLVLCLKVQH
jgi:hypothetical protein